MKHLLPYASIGLLLGSSAFAQEGEKPPGPVIFEQQFEEPQGFLLQGQASVVDMRKGEKETAAHVVALNSVPASGLNSEANASVEMEVTGVEAGAGEWLRFSFAGMPEKNFAVKSEEDLVMKIKYFGKNGEEPLDGVVKEIYPAVEADRKDIHRNGNDFKNGAVTWPRYAFDFRLPFNDIDTLRISVTVRKGAAQGSDASFLVDDMKVEHIAMPATQPPVRKEARDNEADTGETADVAETERPALLPLGGHWYYLPKKDETTAPKHFDSKNLDRLVYKAGKAEETPFAMARGTWLRKGNKDATGEIVQEDRWVDNSVEVDFAETEMTIKSVNLPNHPTGLFPGYLRNPNFIQEKKLTFTLPLEPKQDPNAKAMNNKNRNNALPKGPVGVAVNGVIFYNPFDAGTEEAVNMMDRCCGHPDPGNFYHYHKYPVCARSPFEDAGHKHSPLIGWAFDGFPVYGPYEGDGEMAMDSKKNPLNEFNIHRDDDRGWHYHVSPGRFPYIIGGYWGKAVESNMMKAPPMGAPGGPPTGPGGRGPGGGPPPPRMGPR